MEFFNDELFDTFKDIDISVDDIADVNVDVADSLLTA